MANLATEIVPSSGLNAAYTAAAASHRVLPGSILHVKNQNASPCTVTLVTPATIDGLALADKTISVTNGQERFIYVPTISQYIDPADGRVEVQFSVTASVTVAVITKDGQ